MYNYTLPVIGAELHISVMFFFRFPISLPAVVRYHGEPSLLWVHVDRRLVTVVEREVQLEISSRCASEQNVRAHLSWSRIIVSSGIMGKVGGTRNRRSLQDLFSTRVASRKCPWDLFNPDHLT